MKGLFNWKWAF